MQVFKYQCHRTGKELCCAAIELSMIPKMCKEFTSNDLPVRTNDQPSDIGLCWLWYAMKAHVLTISRTIYKQHSSWKELARVTMNGCWSWLSIERIFFSDKMCSTCLNLITSVFRSIFTAKCCCVTLCVANLTRPKEPVPRVTPTSKSEMQEHPFNGCCIVVVSAQGSGSSLKKVRTQFQFSLFNLVFTRSTWLELLASRDRPVDKKMETKFREKLFREQGHAPRQS